MRSKTISFILALAFVFQSMTKINSHTYSIGFENFHYQCPTGIYCCFGVPLSHSAYNCGKKFHIDY